MEAQKNIAKFQEKFVVPVPANIAKIVDERDRKILADSYLKLYSGFSWINWTNGHSLGRAWQTALTQCESFINTKKNNNPALKHLRNVFKSHKKYWSRVIMTHRDSENKISGNADWVAQMRAYGMQLIREAMDKINLILARYNERIEELQIERQNAQEHGVAHVQMSGATIHIAGASNTANAEQNINGAQTAKVQSAGNTNAQPMNANIPVTEQPAIAQQATQSQPQQAVAHQQAIAQSTVAQQHAKAQQSVAQQNTPAQAQKQSQQFALTEPVKASERAISVNLHKQALAQATEKLKQLQPAIAKQTESALHNIAAQQVAKPQVQVAKPKPQLSGLVQNRAQPKLRVASIAKLQSQNATPVPRKPHIPAARPQVQVAKPKPQLSGLVQNHTQPTPRVASVAKLQTQANIVAKVPHRPNINMILFKNFNQRVA
ncbi:MAG: hypothetical protein IJE79_00610 [Alphaproteobacteria bacterium]|nr:hypothetical protein [Alphaproteobacteria bacterium]